MSILRNSEDESGLISHKNISHYDQNAAAYDEGTQDHDVSQNIDALLRAIKTNTPFHLLDFGCGPGRDLQTFTKLGHVAKGLEGSQQAAQIASLLCRKEITCRDIYFFQIALKLARESWSHKEDNLLDLAAYVGGYNNYMEGILNEPNDVIYGDK
jgi:SAM-dependent methyltransferase